MLFFIKHLLNIELFAINEILHFGGFSVNQQISG